MDAVTAFAALDADAVIRALNDISLLPPGGRLTRIRSSDWELIASKAPAGVPTPSASEPPPLIRFQGAYLISKEVFVGDVISATPATSSVDLSLLDGPLHEPRDHVAFDSDCLEGGLATLSFPEFKGVLYFPVSYSSIARRSVRAAYERMFDRLPADRTKQLVAFVYDVPRDPGFAAITQLKRSLSAHFGSILLRITDPEFQVEKLPTQIVHGVSYALPAGNERLRLAALRRFAGRGSFYNRKKIWVSVTNVRARVELEACAALRIRVIAGPAVCPLRSGPVGGYIRSMAALNIAG